METISHISYYKLKLGPTALFYYIVIERRKFCKKHYEAHV